MFVSNTGEMAVRFNEEGINSSGSLTKPLRNPPAMTGARKLAENTIINISTTRNQPLGVVIRKVLTAPDAIPELQSFVQARGESPNSDPTKLAVQAALIRAAEIGLVAKKLDTDDTDALQAIEVSEQNHVEDNTQATTSILSPSTAGALNLLVGRIAAKYAQNGGSGKLCDWVTRYYNKSGASSYDNVNYGAAVNNADGPDLIDTENDLYISGDETVGGSSSDSSSSSGGGFWSNLFDGIDKVVNAVTKVSGAVNTTVGNVKSTSGSIYDQIVSTGGDIGSASIDTYLKQNWLKIVGVILALIIITIILLRIGRK
jgi:hypothetical protein